MARVFGNVLFCSFRYKMVGIPKNRDAKCERPACGAGPRQAAENCRGGYKIVLAWKAVTLTDLLEIVTAG